MKQQNLKCNSKILIKNRRILTRTEQSREKLRYNMNSNSFLNKTLQSEQFQSDESQEHNTHKPKRIKIQPESDKQMIFWKTTKRRRMKSQIQENTEIIQTKASKAIYNYCEQRKTERQNSSKLKFKNKSLGSKVFQMYKHRMFSHKDLKIKNKAKVLESSSRLHNETTSQFQDNLRTSSSKQLETSLEENKFKKMHALLEKRFKTQNSEMSTGVEDLLKDFVFRRKQKLQLNSKQYAINLKMKHKPNTTFEDDSGFKESSVNVQLNVSYSHKNTKKQDQDQNVSLNQISEKQIFQERRKQLKLPNSLVNKIKNADTVQPKIQPKQNPRTGFTSIQDEQLSRNVMKTKQSILKQNNDANQPFNSKTIKKQVLKCQQDTEIKFNGQNKNRDSIHPDNNKKPSNEIQKSYRSNDQIQKQIQKRQNEIKDYSKNKIKPPTSRSEQDNRVAKKQIGYSMKEASDVLPQFQSISVQDINVVHFSEVSTARNQIKQTQKQTQIPTDNPRQYDLFQTFNSKQIMKSESNTTKNIQKRLKKITQKTMDQIKKKNKQKLYDDVEQIQFVEQIILTESKNTAQRQTFKKPPKNNAKKLKDNNNIYQNVETVDIPSQAELKVQQLEQIQKPSCQLKPNIEIKNQEQSLNQKLIKAKNTIDEIICTGQVAGYCSNLLPKNQLDWIVPALLLYKYCYEVISEEGKVYQQALKVGLCANDQFETFCQQKQMLKVNLQKAYKKATKKKLLTPNLDDLVTSRFSRNNPSFFELLAVQINNFVQPNFKKKSAKNDSNQQRKNTVICANKMITAFLKGFDIEFNNQTVQIIKMNFLKKPVKKQQTVGEIDWDNLTEKESENYLYQNYQKFQVYRKIIEEIR